MHIEKISYLKAGLIKGDMHIMIKSGSVALIGLRSDGRL